MAEITCKRCGKPGEPPTDVTWGGEIGEAIPVPVQGLGDAGRFGQIQAAQSMHRINHLRSEGFTDIGGTQPNDVDLLGDRRVADPVIKASTLQRIMEFAGSVRREDNNRPFIGHDRAQLRNRDLEIRKQLKQECFELVVSAVDLVD